MNPPDSLGTELVVHADSLRRLARDLLGDPHLADDAVQDAMHRALVRPPRAVGALGAWLRTVVRRGALDLRRGERRRRAREHTIAAAAEAAEAAGDGATAEQVETMRHVLAAVQALAEPYRSTIWQRYYGDLTPRAIATRHGVPVKTVKTRLARALAQLRERLDHTCGDRRGWSTALAPVLASPGTAPLGVVLMSTKSWLVAAGLLVAALVVAWPLVAEGPAVDVAPSSGTLVASTPGSEVAPSAATPADATPERNPAAAAAPDTPLTIVALAPLLGGVALGGVVLDVDGNPVPDVKVVGTTLPFPDTRTDATGRFRATRTPGMVTLRVADARWVTVLEPTLFDHDVVHDELTIVVAPAVQVAGTVVDQFGAPVAQAQLTATLGRALRPHIPRVLDRCVDAKFATATGDDGAFAFGPVPLLDTARLRIEARGHRDLEVPVADARTRDRFVLERTTLGDVLEGIVVGVDGQPLREACVFLPSWSVVTAPDGTFRLETWKATDLPAGTLPELTAIASGHLPAKLRALTPDWRSRSAWPRELRLQLGAAAEPISGVVLHADGTPVADVQVSFAPPEPEQIRPTLFDANALAGAALREQFERLAGTPAVGAFTTLPAVAGSYPLRVFDPQTLELMRTEPIRAGSKDVVLRFPARDPWPPLRGVVVDRRGQPVAGADWLVERDDPFATPPGTIHGPWHQATAEGVIEQPPLARSVRTLCVKAAGMADWVRFPIVDLAGGDFRVTVPVGCRARIEVAGAYGDVDRAGLVDLAGRSSPVVFTQGNVAFGTHVIPLQGGRSETFVALDDCVELVLFRGGTEVARVPIALRPGEATVLRP